MFPTNAPADDAPAVDQHTAAENGASHGSNASAFSNASVAEQLVSLVSNTIINEAAFANNCGIPPAALIHTLPAHLPEVPQIRRAPARCLKCNGYVNTYTTVDFSSKTWSCNFCGRNHSTKSDMPVEQLAAYPELNYQAVDYLSGEDAAAAADPPTSLVLVIDATLDEDLLAGLTDNLMPLLRVLPAATQLILMVYDSVLAVYDLSSSTPAAVTFPGTAQVAPSLVAHVLATGAVRSMPLSACLPNLPAVLDSIRPYQKQTPARERPRCLGAAIDLSLNLLAAQRQLGPDFDTPRQTTRSASDSGAGAAAADAFDGRIVVVTGGPITAGPGTVPLEVLDSMPPGAKPGPAMKAAMQYVAYLAESASALEAPVDIVAGCWDAVSTGLLTPLVYRSGGSIMVHHGFGDFFASHLGAALSRRVGSDGLLDVHLSDGLRVAQLIGTVTPLELNKAQLAERKLSPAACSVSSYDQGQCCTLLLEVTRQLKEEAVEVQVVQRWRAPAGHYVTRVTTRQITVTGSSSEFFRSISLEAVVSVICKRLVLEAQKAKAAALPGKAEEARYAAAAQLTHLARRFGRQVTQRGWLRSKSTLMWPPELFYVAQALYHLQRSPMLDHRAGTPDERQLLMSLFLKAPLTLAPRMVVPRLYSLCFRSRTFMEVPAVDLVAWPDTVMVLDHGSSIFIWIGDMDPEELQQLETQRSNASGSLALRKAHSLAASLGATPRRASSLRSGAELPLRKHSSLARAVSGRGGLDVLLATGGPLRHSSITAGGASEGGADGYGMALRAGSIPFRSNTSEGGEIMQRVEPCLPLTSDEFANRALRDASDDGEPIDGPAAAAAAVAFGAAAGAAPAQGSTLLSDDRIMALANRGSSMGLALPDGVAKARTPTEDESFALECVSLAKAHAMRLAKGRIPVPELALIMRSTPDSWEVMRRLMPIHGDSRGEQVAQLPMLADLSHEELESLVAMHGEAREQSLIAWCRAFGVEVASAAS